MDSENSRVSSSRKQYPGKFGEFVSRFSPDNLAAELGVDATNVYAWLNGRYSPRIRIAIRIVKIARREGTELTIQDVYQREIKLLDKEKTRHAVLSGRAKEDRARHMDPAPQRAG